MGTPIHLEDLDSARPDQSIDQCPLDSARPLPWRDDDHQANPSDSVMPMRVFIGTSRCWVYSKSIRESLPCKGAGFARQSTCAIKAIVARLVTGLSDITLPIGEYQHHGRLVTIRWAFGINMNYLAQPQRAKVVAQRAEALGFESLWTGEHVVLPEPRQAPSPQPRDPDGSSPCFSGLPSGCDIYHQAWNWHYPRCPAKPRGLSQRNCHIGPLVRGPLLFGIGAGYLHQEFEALGIDFDSRGPKTDEAIDAMRALWGEEHPTYAGKHVEFRGVNAFHDRSHRLAQTLSLAEPARRRSEEPSLKDKDGTDSLDVAQTKAVLERLTEAKNRFDRPAWLGEEIEISITPPKPLTKTMMEDYAALGVHRLIPMLGFTPKRLFWRISRRWLPHWISRTKAHSASKVASCFSCFPFVFLFVFPSDRLLLFCPFRQRRSGVHCDSGLRRWNYPSKQSDLSVVALYETTCDPVLDWLQACLRDRLGPSS